MQDPRASSVHHLFCKKWIQYHLVICKENRCATQRLTMARVLYSLTINFPILHSATSKHLCIKIPIRHIARKRMRKAGAKQDLKWVGSQKSTRNRWSTYANHLRLPWTKSTSTTSQSCLLTWARRHSHRSSHQLWYRKLKRKKTPITPNSTRTSSDWTKQRRFNTCRITRLKSKLRKNNDVKIVICTKSSGLRWLPLRTMTTRIVWRYWSTRLFLSNHSKHRQGDRL